MEDKGSGLVFCQISGDGFTCLWYGYLISLTESLQRSRLRWPAKTGRSAAQPTHSHGNDLNMDTSAFWKLVDKARRMSEDDAEQQLEELTTLLEALPTEEIVEFHYIFCSFFHASYTWPLWGAAYLIGGGCSDDSFDYFRGWLISRGEKVFAAAVADPDKLASMIKEEDQDIDCQVRCV